MNNSVFINTGGYPLKAERLQELQTAYSIFNAMGWVVGNYSIIEGCTVTGSNTSNGVVFIDGEVFEFVGGATMNTVMIVEQETAREFQDGNVSIVHKRRFVTFGTSPGAFTWSEFKRGLPTNELQALLDAKASNAALLSLTARVSSLEAKNAVFTSAGGVLLWMKPAGQIPEGWAEYVPMRGRFPVGFEAGDTSFGVLGGEGGSKTKQLSINEMPAHSHPITLWDEEGAGAVAGGSPGGIPNGNGVTQSTGQGNAFSILNPYRIVHFIHYIGA